MSNGVKFEGFEDPRSNFTRIPNAFLEAMHIIDTLGEMKVVYYILRNTWGYQDDCKKLTLDEFQNGRKRKDGSRMDDGTGLAKSTIIDGLRRAEEHGFIQVEVDDSDAARIKKTYRLCMRSGVQESDTRGMKIIHPGPETIHRSEKETSLKDTSERSATPPPVSEDGYRIEYHFKDKEFVETIGTVAAGPWRVKACLDCGSEVKIEEKDIFVECQCGMHEYKLLSHKPKAKVKVHPAIVILRKKIGQRQLNQEQITLVESTVGENQKDLDLWQKVIVGWLQHGWFEGNIAGMIGWYNRREIPYTGRGKEKQPEKPAHYFTEAMSGPTKEQYEEALAYAQSQETKGG